MRLNQFLAHNTSLSRRKADEAIQAGRVEINSELAKVGDVVIDSDKITLDGQEVLPDTLTRTIMLYKPVGFVCSRNGQGALTIYDLLPKELHHLNPVGRLDKDSSGLLLMTNDGQLAYELTHPSFEKVKVYQVTLDKPLSQGHEMTIAKEGIALEDGISKFELKPINNARTSVEARLHEGRNRQIRRTFETLGYKVINLHRTHFGPFELKDLPKGTFIDV